MFKQTAIKSKKNVRTHTHTTHICTISARSASRKLLFVNKTRPGCSYSFILNATEQKTYIKAERKAERKSKSKWSFSERVAEQMLTFLVAFDALVKPKICLMAGT